MFLIQDGGDAKLISVSCFLICEKNVFDIASLRPKIQWLSGTVPSDPQILTPDSIRNSYNIDILNAMYNTHLIWPPRHATKPLCFASVSFFLLFRNSSHNLQDCWGTAPLNCQGCRMVGSNRNQRRPIFKFMSLPGI